MRATVCVLMLLAAAPALAADPVSGKAGTPSDAATDPAPDDTLSDDFMRDVSDGAHDDGHDAATGNDEGGTLEQTLRLRGARPDR